jgi:hypothetical protein
MAYRAPNGSQRLDTFVDYETQPQDTTYDTSFSASQDGRRGTVRALNVSSKRRKIRPSDLDDPLASWTPLDDQGPDATEEPAGADGTGEKRKRYESSVSVF